MGPEVDPELLAAVSTTGKRVGAVVYFNDMTYSGSGGTATSVKNAAGFRFLAVDPSRRGEGMGKGLTIECLETDRRNKKSQVIYNTFNEIYAGSVKKA